MKLLLALGQKVGIISLVHLILQRHKILYVVWEDSVIREICDSFGIESSRNFDTCDFWDKLKKADMFISVHSRWTFPPKLFDSIPSVNLHPYMYKYKGKDPIGRAMKKKDRLASVGSHYITKKIDGGQKITEYFKVVDLTNYDDIYSQLYQTYLDVLDDTIRKV